MQFKRNHKLFLGSILTTGTLCIVYLSYYQTYPWVPGQETTWQYIGVLTPAQSLFATPVRGARNIILLETSCVVNESADTSQILRLNSQQACAVESAAKTNPSATVYLYHSCPLNTSSVGLSSRSVRRLLSYRNVRVWHQGVGSVFTGTPLEDLYRSGKMNRSTYTVSHASDVLRFLMLWKYGGIYLDLDFVMMRPLDALDANFASVECCGYFGSSVVALSTDDIGKKVAEACVEELRTNFRGDIFNHNGPALLTRVLRAQCGTNDTNLMTKAACNGFTVLPSTVFYPLLYEWRSLYNESDGDNTMRRIRRGHGIHLWNTQMVWQGGSIGLLRPGSRQPLVQLKQEFCPVVYDETATSYMAGSAVSTVK